MRDARRTIAVLLAILPLFQPQWVCGAEHLRAPYLVFRVGTINSSDIPFGPADVAADDLNGDGRADLAVVCRYSSSTGAGNVLSILMSAGNPSVPLFSAPINYRTSPSPSRVALADLDNDGRLDVVTASAESASVFLNGGGGILVPRGSYSLGSAPQGLRIADLNGDGRKDLALATDTGVRVFLASGSPGSFGAAASYSVGGSSVAIAAGLVDGDAVPDLVVATKAPNTLAIFHGVGDGAFTAAGTPALLYEPTSLELADMTGNGTPEAIVASGPAMRLVVHGNDGMMPFAGVTADLLLGGNPLDLVARDLNSDGLTDVAAAMKVGSNGSLQTGGIFLGNGVGGFFSDYTIDLGPWLEAIVAGDMDGDGRPDLAACGAGQTDEIEFQQAVQVVLQSSSGTYGIGTSYRTPVYDATTCRVISANVDRDGKSDLVIAGFNSATSQASLTIRPGLGDGTWDPGFEFIVAGDGPPRAVAGDFNRDGKTDLAVTRFSSTSGNTTVTYLGNGDGTVVPLGASILSAKEVFATGDFDRDGKLDLITADSTSFLFKMVLLRGNGDGTFTFSWEASFPPATARKIHSAAAGDVNRDGKLDIVCSVEQFGTFPAESFLLLGNGDGTLGTPSQIIPLGGSFSFTLDDLTQDGILDIVFPTYPALGSGIRLCQGNGDGTFQTATILTGPWQHDVASALISDVNRDGHLDLIADIAEALFFPETAESRVSVLLGDQMTNFGAATDYGAARNSLGLTLVDANRDGRDDVVVADRDPGPDPGSPTPWLLTLLGNGPPTFDFPGFYVPSPTPAAALSLAMGDFTRDGNLDAVVTRSDPSGDHYSTLMIGNGNGEMTPTISNLLPQEPIAAAVEDLNRDGIPDVAIACGAGDAVIVQLGTPYDTLTVPATVAIGLGYEFSDIAIADFNRDGKLDLAAASAGTFTILSFPGDGDGAFGAPLQISTGSAGPTSIAVGDINRDGKPDLIAALGVAISPNSIGVLFGNGDGTFQTIRLYSVGANPQAITLADLNRDGVLDAAVSRSGAPGSQFVAVLFGNLAGGFGGATSYAVGGNAYFDVTAADIDGDGILDLLAPNGFAVSTFSYLRGLGPGTFAAKEDHAIGASPFALAVGDLNRDGRPDIVGALGGAANIAVLLSGASTISAVAGEPAGEAPPAPRLAIRPNPALNRAVLSFRLPQPGPATVDLFDVRGRRVTRLFQGRAEGDLEVTWTGQTEGGDRAASGVYFAKLTGANAAVSRRLVWLR
jgi:hypothetical protein